MYRILIWLLSYNPSCWDNYSIFSLEPLGSDVQYRCEPDQEVYNIFCRTMYLTNTISKQYIRFANLITSICNMYTKFANHIKTRFHPKINFANLPRRYLSTKLRFLIHSIWDSTTISNLPVPSTRLYHNI